jgi:hypothetical protein
MINFFSLKKTKEVKKGCEGITDFLIKLLVVVVSFRGGRVYYIA